MCHYSCGTLNIEHLLHHKYGYTAIFTFSSSLIAEFIATLYGNDASYFRSARFNPIVFGFPLTTKAICNCFDKVSPLPPDTTEERRWQLTSSHCIDIYNYLQSQWVDVWPRWYRIQFASAFVNEKRMIVLHFGKFFHHDDGPIPNDNQLENWRRFWLRTGSPRSQDGLLSFNDCEWRWYLNSFLISDGQFPDIVLLSSTLIQL